MDRIPEYVARAFQIATSGRRGPVVLVLPEDMLARESKAADAKPYRNLGLLGLRDCPEAFGASHEDEASKPPRWFADRLEKNIVLGGWNSEATLAGIAGLHIPQGGQGGPLERSLIILNRGDSRIAWVLIQPAGWAEASRDGVFAGLAGPGDRRGAG